MWCIGTLTEEYRERMYDLLDLYARPFQPKEPVVCLDEKSKQLLRNTRESLPIKPGASAKYDYEYARAGTCNLFVAVEPKGGRRTVAVTDHRAKTDFVSFVRHLLEHVYAKARRIHLVMDNLNTHFRKCFEEVLGVRKTRTLLQRAYSITPRNMPAGSTWPKLKSASLIASVLIGVCRTVLRSPPRSLLGKRAAMPSIEASSGRSLDRTQIEKWGCIMFHN